MAGSFGTYWIELLTEENTLLALPPISRIVPTTITRITANITAYSAMSWPRSSDQKCCRKLATLSSTKVLLSGARRQGKFVKRYKALRIPGKLT
jgi:hypothetical protein